MTVGAEVRLVQLLWVVCGEAAAVGVAGEGIRWALGLTSDPFELLLRRWRQVAGIAGLVHRFTGEPPSSSCWLA